MHQIDDIVEKLGYPLEMSSYHFLQPNCGLDYGLHPIGNDLDIRKLLSFLKKHNHIRVYIEHENVVNEESALSTTSLVHQVLQCIQLFTWLLFGECFENLTHHNRFKYILFKIISL